MLNEAERRLAALLIQTLNLEGVQPDDIDPEAPLFGTADPDSLGLDSIDALEIALMVAQHYGVQIKAEDENNRQIFSSLRALTAFVESQRTGAA